jgi:hypothetical protein
MGYELRRVAVQGRSAASVLTGCAAPMIRARASDGGPMTCSSSGSDWLIPEEPAWQSIKAVPASLRKMSPGAVTIPRARAIKFDN